MLEYRQKIEPTPLPPLSLIASGMILGMMDGAKMHGELVADLEALGRLVAAIAFDAHAKEARPLEP